MVIHDKISATFKENMLFDIYVNLDNDMFYFPFGSISL